MKPSTPKNELPPPNQLRKVVSGVNRIKTKLIFLLAALLCGLSSTELAAAPIVQNPGADYVAFEAENFVSISNGPPTPWVLTNDAAAIGGQAIFQVIGAQQTGYPVSFVLYAIRFSQPGTYNIYYRWRADQQRTDQDPNSANSFKLPNDWGDLPEDGTSANFTTASVNNARQIPGANIYNIYPFYNTATASWSATQTLPVSQAQVDAGTPLIFKIGTREMGMYIDRFVLSTRADLSESEFNSLASSGYTNPPLVLSAVGSAGLTNASVNFDSPLLAASIQASDFGLSGGINVTGAALDPFTSTRVILTTSTQVQGSNYLVTVNTLTNASGVGVAANSTARFTAWKLTTGSVVRTFYYNLTGGTTDGTVADLTGDPNYPLNPSASDSIQGFQINNSPVGLNFGARVDTYFTPTNSGVYEFFIYSDDEAELYLSADQSPDNLQLLLSSPCCSTNFSDTLFAASPSLTVGNKYLLRALWSENATPSLLGVGVRPPGNTAPAASLPILGGNLITTLVNLDALSVNFTQQPLSTTNSAGSRATFSAQATTPSGIVSYQWRVNGTDIAGANRPLYITPLLTLGDSGKIYTVAVSGGGNPVSSSPANLTVIAGTPSPLQAYVGVNFVGAGPGGVLTSSDVAGVVQQEHYNNVSDLSALALPLLDATGAASPVTLSFDPVPLAVSTTGLGESSADRSLLQGYIQNANAAFTVTLNGVPSGNYNLILYSLGFNFNSTYEEDIALTGASVYPTFYVQAQDAGQYLNPPGFVRMSNTNSTNRGPVGNYAQFDNISPALDGSLIISITPQSTNTGVTVLPPLNGLQLVRAPLVTPQPVLATSYNSGIHILTVSWSALATGFTLQSSPTLGTGASWTAVAGTPNPITGAGSTIVNTTIGGGAYYRLFKP